MQIHFLSDVLAAVASLDLKVPIVFKEHPPVSVSVVELAEVGLFETCALSICSHRFICDVIIKDFRGNFCEIHD